MKQILILGATGGVGSLLVGLLKNEPDCAVTVMVRSPEKFERMQLAADRNLHGRYDPR